MTDPTLSCEVPCCSAVDLSEIPRSSKINSWIWSIISGVVTVLGRRRRGASQVEKSPRLNWATQFLMVAYDGAYSPNVSCRMMWISFGALPCRKKKILDESSRLDVFEIAHVAWHASTQPMYLEKTCNSAHEQTHLSKDTIDSFLRHREVGLAKDLSATPRNVGVFLISGSRNTYILGLYLIGQAAETVISGGYIWSEAAEIVILWGYIWSQATEIVMFWGYIWFQAAEVVILWGYVWSQASERVILLGYVWGHRQQKQ